MRKLIISLAAAGAALAFASPAAAQYYPQQNYGYGGQNYGYGQQYGYGYNGYGQNNYGQVRALQVRIDNGSRSTTRPRGLRTSLHTPDLRRWSTSSTTT